MLVAWVLLAAPVAAVVLFWESWAWAAAAAAVAAVEYVALRRSQRFSARLWRNVPIGRRQNRERAAETIYVLSAVAGVVLLVLAALRAL